MTPPLRSDPVLNQNAWWPVEQAAEGVGRRRKAPERFASFAADPDAESPSRSHSQKTRKTAAERKQPSVKEQAEGAKRRRCLVCVPCLASDCKKCKYCLDMPKYGGKGTVSRVCAPEIAGERERETVRETLSDPSWKELCVISSCIVPPHRLPTHPPYPLSLPPHPPSPPSLPTPPPHPPLTGAAAV